MHIDCRSCPVQGRGCGDCVVALFLDEASPSGGLPLDPREAAAVHAFRCAGLVSDAETVRVRARSTSGRLAGVG